MHIATQDTMYNQKSKHFENKHYFMCINKYKSILHDSNNNNVIINILFSPVRQIIRTVKCRYKQVGG